MPRSDTELTPSLWLLIRNLAIAVGGGVGGYYMVGSGETVIVILGGGLLLFAPIMLLMPLFMGLPARGPCPECGGTIETTGSRENNLLCRGCNGYLDAEDGKLRRSDPDRIETSPTFAAPSPWKDITLVVYPTIALSAQDYLQDLMTTKKEGVRVMEAQWPHACAVCRGTPVRFDTVSRVLAKPGTITDTQIVCVARDVPYCSDHKDGLIFDRIESSTPGASGCFGMKFRSHAYRNAFMRANSWTFTWHQ